MDKVREITFHVSRSEIDDCILRAAELIKEGYTVNHIEFNSAISYYSDEEANVYITMRRKN